MRKIIEYTLISVDGVFDSPLPLGFLEYRDDAYLRDGLGLLSACDTMLMGRRTYQTFSKLWPGRVHPWADRLNSIQKYVFSSTLDKVEWDHSTLVRGEIATEIAELKAQKGRDIVLFGHSRIGEILLKHRLLDVLDLSIHPLFAGEGTGLFRNGQSTKLRHVATKTFSKIVKLTYEPQY